VGAEVKAAFEAHAPEAASCFRSMPGSSPAAGKWLADLPALARQRLRAVGVSSIHGNDGSDAWCTVNNPSRFFSHRRDGVSGRFAALVWKA
jgi:copper oxidase (laccase) domain-containing protein